MNYLTKGDLARIEQALKDKVREVKARMAKTEDPGLKKYLGVILRDYEVTLVKIVDWDPSDH